MTSDLKIEFDFQEKIRSYKHGNNYTAGDWRNHKAAC
jgi:hypothetical protein